LRSPFERRVLKDETPSFRVDLPRDLSVLLAERGRLTTRLAISAEGNEGVSSVCEITRAHSSWVAMPPQINQSL
jgi:hypothetical protein